MDFFIPIQIEVPKQQIAATDKVLLIGSCFTEHIGGRLQKYGWQIFQNPTGIVFNPNSMRRTVDLMISRHTVEQKDLFFAQELWHHWDFHSKFSDINPHTAISAMNRSLEQGFAFLQRADWVFITLGTAFQYFFGVEKYGVNNCHRVPAAEFEKKLLSVNEIQQDLQHILDLVRDINPKTKFIFTISPVRHIKDGVVENNRSKARLIEAAHFVCERNNDCHYFPAYELLIDVLRDYRFYDADLVHPNYAATQTIWEQFVQKFVSEDAHLIIAKMIEMNDAFQHKSRFPESLAHQRFMEKYLQKTKDLKQKYPHLDLQVFMDYFERKS